MFTRGNYGLHILVLFLLNISGTLFADLVYENYLYEQGFESTNPVQSWTSSGNYTINSNGVTTAKAFSGTHSYVIDITFNSPGYFYLKIPISDIPCKNILNLSARILVENVVGENCFAGVGRNIYYPISTSGCGPIERLATTGGQWKLTKGDLINLSPNYDINVVPDVVAASIWGATADHIEVRLDKIGFFINNYSSSQARIRIYIDDIKLEGTIPTEASYTSELAAKWAQYATKFNSLMNGFSSATTQAQSDINNLSNLSAFEQELAAKAQQRLNEINSNYNLTTITSRGWILNSEYNAIRYRLSQASGIVTNISMERNNEITRDKHLLYNVAPTENNVQSVLPDAAYINASIDNEISVTATPGEYESASFAVEALDSLSDLSVAVTDLSGSSTSVIPSSDVDIRVVKCWYQNGTGSYYNESGGAKVLVPELLLKDDSLISVDYVNEKNYIDLDGTYIWISDPTPVAGQYTPSNAAYPVEDSSVLLPVDISDNDFKQFWLTFKIPADAIDGTYTGYLTLSTPGDGEIGRYKITVNVLPFKLKDSLIRYGIYYRGMLKSDETGTVSSEYKTAEQYANEMKDMLSHGVTNSTLYQLYANLDLIEDELAIRTNQGMNENRLYYVGMYAGKYLDPEIWEDRKNKTITLAGITDDYGISENYIMGGDEARGDDLLMQRETWEAIQEGGGKIFSAGFYGSLREEYPWGKVLNLHFDETSGTKACDLTDNANDATLFNVNSPNCWVGGVIGNALQLGAAGDYVDCGNDISLNIADTITIEAWIKPTSYVTGYAKHMFYKKNDTTDANYDMYFFGDTSGASYKKIRFYANAGGTWQAVSPSYTINTLSQWYHVVWTYDSTNGGMLYVNGESQGNAVGSGSLATNSARLIFDLDGQIDEFRIYNRVLREDEIVRQYDDGTNGKRPVVGDLKDMHNNSYKLSDVDADLAHSVTGHEIFSYGNPFTGAEDPEIFRRNYGLRIWAHGYDGVMDYAYQHSSGNIWNDFDSGVYKDTVFAYPTINGVIDTIAWEGFREGVDDTKYLAKLLKLIEEAPSSQAKDNANDFVNSLTETDRLKYDNLDDVREEMISHILAMSGLCANWRFNESSGSVAYDSSGNDNDAYLCNMNPPNCWVDGKMGNSLQFGAAGDYLNCGNDDSLSISDKITIDFWFKPDSYVTGYAKHILYKKNDTTDANYDMYFFGDTAGASYKKICFFANAGGTWQAVSPSYTINTLNQWYHIVWTYDSSNGGLLYVNGQSQGSAVGSGSLATNNSHLYVDLSGLLDELKIYNRIVDSGVCAAWNFNESSGSVAYDSSGNNNDAILCNMSSPSCWVDGHTGNGLQFGAVDDYLNCGNDDSLSISDKITIDFWFKPDSYVSGYAQHILFKKNDTTDANYDMYFFGDTAGTDYKKVRFYANAGGTWQAVSPSYTINTLNQWYHIVWTYDSSTGGLLYVNGQSQGSAVGSGSLATNNNHLYVDLSGVLDELKIYDRVIMP